MSALERASDFGIVVTELKHIREDVPDVWEVILPGGERKLFGSEAAAEADIARRIPPG
jgi:hypothetical protein